MTLEETTDWLERTLLNRLRECGVTNLSPLWKAVAANAAELVIALEPSIGTPEARKRGLAAIDAPADAYREDYQQRAEAALNEIYRMTNSYSTAHGPAAVALLKWVTERMAERQKT